MNATFQSLGPLVLPFAALAIACGASTPNHATPPNQAASRARHQPEPAPTTSDIPTTSNIPTASDITTATFIGFMATMVLPSAEDLDGDRKSETIRQDSVTFAWHIGSHVYNGCSGCNRAILVDFDKDDGRRELIIFGYPEEETMDVAVLQVGPAGISATKWTTTDGEVRWDASGALWIDKCGETRTLYDLHQGTLVLIQQQPSPIHRYDCPG